MVGIPLRSAYHRIALLDRLGGTGKRSLSARPKEGLNEPYARGKYG